MDGTKGAEPRDHEFYYVVYNVQTKEGWIAEAAVFASREYFRLAEVHAQLFDRHNLAIRIENWSPIRESEAYAWLELQARLDLRLNKTRTPGIVDPSKNGKVLSMIKGAPSEPTPLPAAGPVPLCFREDCDCGFPKASKEERDKMFPPVEATTQEPNS